MRLFGGSHLLAPTWARRPRAQWFFLICSGITHAPSRGNLIALYHAKRRKVERETVDLRKNVIKSDRCPGIKRGYLVELS